MDFRNFIQNIDPRARKIIVRIFMAAALISALWWLSGSAFIQIDVEGGSANKATSYLIASEKTTLDFKDNSNTIKRFVRAGRYEIQINQGDKGYYAIVDVGGFFQTTRIVAKLQQESDRVFTGNNPSPCTTYHNKRLYSYTCNGNLNDLRLHVPATDASPTYTVSKGVAYPDSGTLVDLRSMDGKLVGLVRSFAGSSNNWKYKLYILADNLKTKSSKALDELKGSQDYMVSTYLDGIIIYRQDFSEIYYMSSPSLGLGKISLVDGGGNDDLQPQILSGNSRGEIVTTHSNNTEGETSLLEGVQDPTEANLESGEEDEHEHENTITAIDYFKQGRHVSDFKINGNQIIDIKPCGNNKICALSKDLLTIYSNDGSKIFAQLKGAQSINTSGNKVVFSNGSSLIEFSPETLTGHIIYSIGSVNFCGINQDDKTYTLCIIKNDQKFALTVFPDKHVSDLIDRRIFQLMDLAEVKNISINNDYIHISANFVPSIYNPKTLGYEPDKTKRENVRRIIMGRISELGISGSRYKIVVSP